MLCRALGVPKLDGEKNQIDRRDAGRIVGRLHVLQVQIAERAFDLEAILADRFEMRAAREEHDIVPGRDQPRAEIAADGARRHYTNTHHHPAR